MVLVFAACSSGPARPVGVPATAVHLSRQEDALVVAGAASERVDWSEITADPTDPYLASLAGAVGRAVGPAAGGLWLDLPADMPFWAVRRILGSAREVETGPMWLAVGADAVGLGPNPRFDLSSCPESGSVTVTGAEPLVTLSLQQGAEGAWVVASARFVPVTAEGPTDGLEPRCLDVAPCEALYPPGPAREACAAPEAASEAASERVVLGGSTGCFLPIARRPEEVGAWRSALPAVLTGLGLGEHRLVVVMPEARTRVDAILAVLGGYADAGFAVPSLGTTALVEGNDGPPVCNAPVRDAAALEVAEARWLGSLRPAAVAD